MVGSKHVRLRVGVIGLGRLWETRHKPSLARLEDRFRITAIYDQVYRRAEIEAAQIGCAACEGLCRADRATRRGRDLSLVAPMVWTASDRAGLCGGQGGLLRTAADGRPGRAGRPGEADRSKRHRVHARVRPTLLSGDLTAQGAAGDPIGCPAADRGTLAALWFRPLRIARSHNPDRSGAAPDRSGEFLARLVLFRAPVAS